MKLLRKLFLGFSVFVLLFSSSVFTVDQASALNLGGSGGVTIIPGGYHATSAARTTLCLSFLRAFNPNYAIFNWYGAGFPLGFCAPFFQGRGLPSSVTTIAPPAPAGIFGHPDCLDNSPGVSGAVSFPTDVSLATGIGSTNRVYEEGRTVNGELCVVHVLSVHGPNLLFHLELPSSNLPYIFPPQSGNLPTGVTTVNSSRLGTYFRTDHISTAVPTILNLDPYQPSSGSPLSVHIYFLDQPGVVPTTPPPVTPPPPPTPPSATCSPNPFTVTQYPLSSFPTLSSGRQQFVEFELAANVDISIDGFLTTVVANGVDIDSIEVESINGFSVSTTPSHSFVGYQSMVSFSSNPLVWTTGASQVFKVYGNVTNIVPGGNPYIQIDLANISGYSDGDPACAFVGSTGMSNPLVGNRLDSSSVSPSAQFYDIVRTSHHSPTQVSPPITTGALDFTLTAAQDIEITSLSLQVTNVGGADYDFVALYSPTQSNSPTASIPPLALQAFYPLAKWIQGVWHSPISGAVPTSSTAPSQTLSLVFNPPLQVSALNSEEFSIDASIQSLPAGSSLQFSLVDVVGTHGGGALPSLSHRVDGAVYNPVPPQPYTISQFRTGDVLTVSHQDFLHFTVTAREDLEIDGLSLNPAITPGILYDDVLVKDGNGNVLATVPSPLSHGYPGVQVPLSPITLPAGSSTTFVISANVTAVPPWTNMQISLRSLEGRTLANSAPLVARSGTIGDPRFPQVTMSNYFQMFSNERRALAPVPSGTPVPAPSVSSLLMMPLARFSLTAQTFPIEISRMAFSYDTNNSGIRMEAVQVSDNSGVIYHSLIPGGVLPAGEDLTASPAIVIPPGDTNTFTISGFITEVPDYSSLEVRLDRVDVIGGNIFNFPGTQAPNVGPTHWATYAIDTRPTGANLSTGDADFLDITVTALDDVNLSSVVLLLDEAGGAQLSEMKLVEGTQVLDTTSALSGQRVVLNFPGGRAMAVGDTFDVRISGVVSQAPVGGSIQVSLETIEGTFANPGIYPNLPPYSIVIEGDRRSR